MTHLEYASGTTESSVTNLYRRGGKRGLDFLLGLALLPIIVPVVIILCILNSMNVGNPLFLHTRVGKNGRRFNCLKLRTMRPNSAHLLEDHLANNPDAAEEWTRTQKLKNDPRVTAFGHFLRRSSLDELPQIWNVIRGDMSFVGPRPITKNELHHYGVAAQEYLSVRPGVTGVWQIYGRANGCYKERVRMDQVYCHAINITQDLTLIVMTALVLLKATGK